MTRRVVVIGGGICGASAALALATAGEQVTLIERGSSLGGLVTSFSVGGTPLELFYHYLVPGEPEILELLDRLNLTERISWFQSRVAMFSHGHEWPFTSPGDLLRFKPLPFIDRIRTGFGAVALGRENDWASLDSVPAVEWLGRLTSGRAVNEIWLPLLRAKFGPIAEQIPAAWMWARMRQRAGGRKRGREYLGYLRGGFRQMFEGIEAELRKLGAEIRTGERANAITLSDGRVVGVELDAGAIDADAVLFAGQLPALSRLLPDNVVDPRWTSARGLGVVCGLLELSRPLTKSFWINVVDENLPFGGIIEHTNLVPHTDYDGRHVVYLSRYFLPDEDIAKADAQQEVERWVESISHHVPGFSRDAVLAIHGFRTDYAAPLVTLGYSSKIPPIASHIPGLYVSTTAQIYPQDRGMSEGVRMGAEAVRLMLARTEHAL